MMIAAITVLIGYSSLNDAQAQVMLGAPGVGLTYRSEGEVPFSHSTNIGRYYKFVYTGAEAQADADGVPGTYSYDGYMWNKKKKNNHGHGNNVDGVDSSNKGNSKDGEDSDPTVDDEIKDGTGDSTSGTETTVNYADKVPGWWEFLTRVNTHEISGLEYSSAALHQLSDVIRIMFSNPIVIREQTIELSWVGEGNSKDPDGHLYILGSAIKEPPVPYGSLNFGQTMYTSGTQPVFNWDVTRE